MYKFPHKLSNNLRLKTLEMGIFLGNLKVENRLPSRNKNVAIALHQLILQISLQVFCERSDKARKKLREKKKGKKRLSLVSIFL